MDTDRKKIRSAVRREHAESYVLTSLVAFVVTVIAIRVFLQLTGFPQLGNSVLHIAHALWGGLLLFVAVLLPLAFANRWAIGASALLSGIGIGLFIDEVGKFITQANDYFFAPSLSLIYGFVLLNVFVYLYFRRPRQPDARSAMYHALDGLQDALDGDLDAEEAARIDAQAAIAAGSDRAEIASLASAVRRYLETEEQHLPAAESGVWERAVAGVDSLGLRVGRRAHRAAISALMILWVMLVIGFIAVLVLDVPTLDPQVVQWRGPLVAIQIAVGGLMIVAVIAWMTRAEDRALRLAVSGFLLSLVALQTLYFYLSQFAAITATLVQVGFLLILLAYRRWHLGEQTRTGSR